MRTLVYFVRHAESIYVEGMERMRGLSEKGTRDSQKISSILKTREIDIVISSPYERAIQTIKPLADALNKEVILYEGLRERTLGEIGEVPFKKAKQKLYTDFRYKYHLGESSKEAQERAINELIMILKKYEGKTVVLGTHGDIMTLMLNYFDDQYGIEFWESTSMPDIYELQFNKNKLEQVRRIWDEN